MSVTVPAEDMASNATDFLKTSPHISKKLANAEDYPAWAIEAERHLWRMKLTNVVTGSEIDEPPINSEDWKERTYRALDYLMDSCEQEPQAKIRAATTAAQAWGILKDNYEGKTLTHLSRLFYRITGVKFDDQRSTVREHIDAFERAWLQLAQMVVTTSATSKTADGAIVHFIQSDTWKAYSLINTFPRIQPYINIIDSITSEATAVTYANTVARLKEVAPRPANKEHDISPPPGFAATSRPQRFCHKRIKRRREQSVREYGEEVVDVRRPRHCVRECIEEEDIVIHMGVWAQNAASVWWTAAEGAHDEEEQSRSGGVAKESRTQRRSRGEVAEGSCPQWRGRARSGVVAEKSQRGRATVEGSRTQRSSRGGVTHGAEELRRSRARSGGVAHGVEGTHTQRRSRGGVAHVTEKLWWGCARSRGVSHAVE
ncbi:hypothetical protein EV426DRAFT_681798 [Tirmania nivea]|nr:hypothetical protein EV426DRAFT_681798 [Tirmania nivea]